MRAGAHNCYLRIEQRSATLDADYNEPVKTWATFGHVWANLTPVRGRERFAASQIEADVSHRIEIDYDAALGIKPDMRLLYDPAGAFSDPAAITYFEIASIMPEHSSRDVTVILARAVDSHAT
jgi:SPP1 family predicted phage head-tail adaptor